MQNLEIYLSMKKIISLFLCLISASFFFSCKDENTVNPISSSNVSLVGQYNTSGYSYDVYVAPIGNLAYAFLADGTPGLQIINVQIPASPTLASTLATINPANDIFVATVNSVPYAFVSTGFGGLVIADVSNPFTPVIVDTIPLVNDALFSIFVDPVGQIAYLGASSGNLLLYDISSLPGAPLLRGMDNTVPDHIYGIYVTGGIAYLATGLDFGVVIEDVSNPSNPSRVYQFDTPGSAEDLAVGGSYLYIADGSAGVTVYNVANPLNPQYYRSVSTRGTSASIFYNSSSAQFYTAELNAGCEVFSAGGSPPIINQLGFYSNNNNSNGIFFYNPYIYVADSQNGLLILRYSP